MMNLRRMASTAVALAISITVTSAMADPAPVRVGALKFGTVNWELDTIQHHGLDAANGVALEVVELAGKNASAVALQGGAADVIVTDWIWVSRQRAAGADYTFVPYSLAVGALMVRPDAGILRGASWASPAGRSTRAGSCCAPSGGSSWAATWPTWSSRCSARRRC